MVKRILIPVDFSDASQRAAHWGIDLAQQLAGEALILTVLDVRDLRVAMNAGLHGFETDADVKRQVQTWIDEQYSRMIPVGAKNVRREIRRGMVDRELAAAIREYQPDLIVVGSAGLGRRAPMGGKTEHLIAHSDVPVVVIRAR